MDRKTVRKYAKSRTVPKQKQRKRSPLKLEPYIDYIKERIVKYNLSSVRILEEIRKKGYVGSYSTLKAYCKVQETTKETWNDERGDNKTCR